ncbi:MAG TPA: hypothetical protein VFE98_10940 [Candidatus Bathyarchaeia archaeon]|nr:hypothetical protein [Candidatus Bathyarchaeia archaeon]
MTVRQSSDKTLTVIAQTCPYCGENFDELSPLGFENHRYHCWFSHGPGPDRGKT